MIRKIIKIDEEKCNGCNACVAHCKLDVKKVYFSPRLATERKRVADLVSDGEEILDMFAGVGPFPFVIAKEKSVDITAVDINEVAIQYLNENIKINKVKEKLILSI